ncbi:nitrate reductase NapAB chaperone NapD [Anoxybacillus mongoliensis]|uniref:Nitrate reductase NapAB chaperone NapD n=1 Tax=Anoxybacillus mongoliensis TaxID=452565 RepID=A0A7W8N8U6_9BACL|nr:nitrate reductase NapAB chaperone NapD [Anoxybacillus mongoliensis]MCX8001613.1 cytosolic protein [Anoxybacillus mongoliensis]
MKWKYVLTNHNETSERHPDEQLKSRYYKTTQSAALQAVKEIFEQMDGCRIVAISAEHGEISVSLTKGKKAFIVATIVSVRPFETAVDFSVTTETTWLPIDFGFSRQLIIRLYDQLAKRFTYIGSGIYGDK